VIIESDPVLFFRCSVSYEKLPGGKTELGVSDSVQFAIHKTIPITRKDIT
jgi:hypothetical protein